MSTAFSTLCTVTAGKLRLLERASFDAALTRFADGQELVLTIEEQGRKRTNQQSRFFYGPVLKAFESLGYRKQEAHDVLCLHFLPREVTQLDGTIAVVPGHTSELTVPEFNDFIDQCIQLAAEHDIVIQDADQWRKTHGAAA